MPAETDCRPDGGDDDSDAAAEAAGSMEALAAAAKVDSDGMLDSLSVWRGLLRRRSGSVPSGGRLVHMLAARVCTACRAQGREGLRKTGESSRIAAMRACCTPSRSGMRECSASSATGSWIVMRRCVGQLILYREP
jgi:hypothetical protein